MALKKASDSPYWEGKNCKGVGYGPFPFRLSLSHYVLEFFIFKSCGLLKTADLAVENSYFGKYLGKGHAWTH